MLTGGVNPVRVSRERSRTKRFAAQMHSTKYAVPATASKAHSAAMMISTEGMESAVQSSRRRIDLLARVRHRSPESCTARVAALLWDSLLRGRSKREQETR